MLARIAACLACLAACAPIASASAAPPSSTSASVAPAASGPPLPKLSDIGSVSIAAGLAAIWYKPVHPAAVEHELERWLQQAAFVRVTLPPPPEPPIETSANTNPPEIDLQLTSGQIVTLMPTTYFSGRGVPLSRVIQHVPDVLTYQEGSHTWYLKSAPLYHWLMDGGWQREFRTA